MAAGNRVGAVCAEDCAGGEGRYSAPAQLCVFRLFQSLRPAASLASLRPRCRCLTRLVASVVGRWREAERRRCAGGPRGGADPAVGRLHPPHLPPHRLDVCSGDPLRHTQPSDERISQ